MLAVLRRRRTPAGETSSSQWRVNTKKVLGFNTTSNCSKRIMQQHAAVALQSFRAIRETTRESKLRVHCGSGGAVGHQLHVRRVG